MTRTLIVRLGIVVILSAGPARLYAETDPGGEMGYRVLQQREDRLVVALPNRMIVAVQRLASSPVVSAQVWVKTGSIFEQEHVGAGLSHFLEHLLSGGTTSTRSEAESNELLGAIGAQTNAATSLDTVRYYINTTSTYTEQAVDLLSDWMMNSQIEQREYERERSVIQREFEMGRGEPGRVLWRSSLQARYGTHPARHPTIGYLDEFLTVTRDEIYAFYKRMYVPNNMVFVVVGDVDPDKVVSQLTQLWSAAEPGELPEVALPIEPLALAARWVEHTASIDKPRLRLLWPGTRLAAEGDYALDLLASALGQGESSRLVRAVRDEQRFVNTVGAYNLSFSWGEGFFGIDAEVVVPDIPADVRATPAQWRRQCVERARDAILEQVALLRDDGVGETELSRAKRQALASTIYGSQSAQAIASRLARDLIGNHDPDYLWRYAERVQGLKAEELRAAALRFLNPDQLITMVLDPMEPGQEPVEMARPPEPDWAESVKSEPIDLDNRVLVKGVEGVEAASNEGSIGVEPVQRFVLSNGMRVLVGPSTVVPAVSIQMYHLGGLLADEPGHEGVTNAVASMRIKGTKTRSAEQIAAQVEDLGASLVTDCGYNTAYSRGVCLKEDWPTLMELVGDVTLNPVFPKDEWQKLQPRLIAAIKRQSDTWNGELRQQFRDKYFSGHPWAVSPLGRVQVVSELAADALTENHSARLGASEAVLAVFGNVDSQEVVKQAEAIFGAMPAEPTRSLAVAEPAAVEQGVFSQMTDKRLGAVQIGFGPGVKRSHEDYAVMQVIARVLNSFPSGWLEQELRGRGPGLAYAVGAGQVSGLVPGYFTVLFNAEPQKLAEALRRASAAVERIKAQPIDASTLARAKAKVLANEYLFKQTNSDRAAEAALAELYGLGLDESKRLRQQVENLTSDDVLDVARRRLTRPVAVVLSHETQDQESLRQALDGVTTDATD